MFYSILEEKWVRRTISLCLVLGLVAFINNKVMDFDSNVYDILVPYVFAPKTFAAVREQHELIYKIFCSHLGRGFQFPVLVAY